MPTSRPRECLLVRPRRSEDRGQDPASDHRGDSRPRQAHAGPDRAVHRQRLGRGRGRGRLERDAGRSGPCSSRSGSTTRSWRAPSAGPSHIRQTRHIGDFRGWKNHGAYQKSFERLLRDLRASEGAAVPSLWRVAGLGRWMRRPRGRSPRCGERSGRHHAALAVSASRPSSATTSTQSGSKVISSSAVR